MVMENHVSWGKIQIFAIEIDEFLAVAGKKPKMKSIDIANFIRIIIVTRIE